MFSFKFNILYKLENLKWLVKVFGNVTCMNTRYEEKKSTIFHESLVPSPDATNWPKRRCDT